MDPSSPRRDHISYNRLGLPLISDMPLLYRTHYEFAQLMAVPKDKNKLIFATRNPKELLYRNFLLQPYATDDPDIEFIDRFLVKYLKAFDVYDSWCLENRFLVFYEDFIECQDEILLQMLEFMQEEPLYLEDFINHKSEYMAELLDSYVNQHTHNSGGISSQNGPKPIYYTRDASSATLRYIDQYIEQAAPLIWKSYLERFKEPMAHEYD